MKKKFLPVITFTVLLMLVSAHAHAQYTRLIPGKKFVRSANVSVPSYGGLLQSSLDMLTQAADVRCLRNINSALDTKINKIRASLSEAEDYQAVVDYTRCSANLYKIRSGTRPSVIHSPNTKVKTYVVKLIPLLRVGNKWY